MGGWRKQTKRRGLSLSGLTFPEPVLKDQDVHTKYVPIIQELVSDADSQAPPRPATSKALRGA